METSDFVVRAIVEEEIEFTVFAILEFPKSLRNQIQPGLAFNWAFCEGVYTISPIGNNPVG